MKRTLVYEAQAGQDIHDFALFLIKQAKPMRPAKGVFNQFFLIANTRSTVTEVIKPWDQWQRMSYSQ